MAGCISTVDAQQYYPSKNFDVLSDAGNTRPISIWSNGATMWVVDYSDRHIYAYDMSSKSRDQSKEIRLHTDNGDPWGMWSNGATMWIADYLDTRIYAYDMSSKLRDTSKDFDTLSAASNAPADIWSNGATMWVADDYANRIYAYDMSSLPGWYPNYLYLG